MSSSSDMKNMNQAIKPQYPDLQGDQYADSPSGGIVSRDSNYLTVTYDKFGNEVAADRVMHGNATAMEGEWSFDEKHYSDGPWQGGYGASYGVAVTPPSGADRITVDSSRADRGKES